MLLFFDEISGGGTGRILGPVCRIGLLISLKLDLICGIKLTYMQTTKANITVRTNDLIHAFLCAVIILLFMSSAGMAQSSSTQKADTAGPGHDTASRKFHQTLETFTLQGAKPFMQYKPGRIILNVAESPIAAGGNASDIISHIPGVNGMQWQGRTLQVLIDGRSTGLKGDDLKTILDGMAAGSIERVELIEHRSAKYDAQGGAVLNIITVKMKKHGLNGTVTAGLGWGRYARYNEGFNLNYKAGKANWYGGYDYQHGRSWYDYNSDRAIDPARQVTEATHGLRQSDNHSLRIGMDYTINGRSSFGWQAKGMLNQKMENASNRSILSNHGGGGDSLSELATTGHAGFFIPSANAWYKLVFDSTGKELILNADYFHFSKNWDEEFATRYYDPKGVEYTVPSGLRDHSPAVNGILSFSADYVQPVRAGKIEAGIKTGITTTDNDVLWEQREGAAWIKDTGKTNHFIYRENINAVYLNYSRTWKKFEFQAGLRAEQTNTEGRSVTLNQVNKNSYLTLCPNVSIQYSLSDIHQFSLSYQKGIERFGFDVVNPFVRYISQYSYSQGNPYIRPSISHNLALSWSWKNEFMASISYGHFLDALGTVYHTTDQGYAVISTETNLGSAEQFECDLTYTKSLFGGKWVMSNMAGALFAKYNTVTDSRQQAAQWSLLASTDQIFSMGKGWKGEVSGMYFSPLILGVCKYQARYSASLGVSRTILKSKGKLALNISDIFNSLTNRYEIASYGVSSVNVQKTESRALKLVFTYSFGGKSQKNAANKKTGIEDLRQRMSTN